MNKIAFLVPYYNHPLKISKLVNILNSYNLPVLIVDDGSDEESKKALKGLNAKILRLYPNQGKGAAIKKGLKYLHENSFTHALQIDADLQHDTNDIDAFLTLSQKFKDNFICGSPIYGKDAPKARLYGRKITNFWIKINSLGRLKQDGMCGFRLYPINEKMLKAIDKTKSERMSFEIEILLYALWEGMEFKWIDTKIIYPVDSCSHFNAFFDNFQISLCHARLFFTMLMRCFRLFHA